MLNPQIDVDISVSVNKPFSTQFNVVNLYNDNRLEIIDCNQKIDNNEDPLLALRCKKEASLVKCLNLLKNDDRVKIITDSSAYVNKDDWLDKAITTKARKKIQEFIKEHENK